MFWVVIADWKYNKTLTKLIFAGIIQYFNNKGETVKVESFSDAKKYQTSASSTGKENLNFFFKYTLTQLEKKPA